MHGGSNHRSFPAVKLRVCAHDFSNVSEAFGPVCLSLSVSFFLPPTPILIHFLLIEIVVFLHMW